MSRSAFVAIALLLLAGTQNVHAMRCNGRVISSGDFDFQVRERCGAPSWSNRYSEMVVSGIDSPLEHRRERVHEQWSYNFGPTNLVRHLHFVDGRLERIDTGGYGVRAIGEDCSDVVLSRGNRQSEVFLHCGEPASRSSRYEDLLVRDGGGNARIRPVRREEWLYPDGASGAWRRVQFVDGRLDSVERLSR